MMKKYVICVLIATLVLPFCLSACREPELPVREPTALDAEEYRNYAEEVFLNLDDFPSLARQGLRFTPEYVLEDGDYEEKECLPTAENLAASFDPNKGVVVLFNGLQVDDGRRRNVGMGSTCLTAERREHKNDPTYTADDIAYFQGADEETGYDLGKLFYDNGYNVFTFHWEMFADYYGGTFLDLVVTPNVVSKQIWSTENGVYAAYTDENGNSHSTSPVDAINGSVAEWFVAEYCRMTKALTSVFPSYQTANKDVRFVAHSMGGMLCVAGSTLLKLVADDGQLPLALTSNRIALLDSYTMDGKDGTIAWSGYPFCTEGNYYTALHLLVEHYDTAVEFYINEGYTVPFFNVEGLGSLRFDTEQKAFVGTGSAYANEILSLCPVVLIRPYFQNVNVPTVWMDGHNPMREWYFFSLVYDAPTVDGFTVPTARMSDAEIKAQRGCYYEMVIADSSVPETVGCADDVFNKLS